MYEYKNKANPDDMQFGNVQWNSDSVSFNLKASINVPFPPDLPDWITNKLSEITPSINYNLDLTVNKNGDVNVDGYHSEFPALEIYKNVDSGGYEPVYQYNPYDNGHGPLSLAKYHIGGVVYVNQTR